MNTEEVDHCLFDLQRSIETLLELGWEYRHIREEVDGIVDDWTEQYENRMRSGQ